MFFNFQLSHVPVPVPVSEVLQRDSELSLTPNHLDHHAVELDLQSSARALNSDVTDGPVVGVLPRHGSQANAQRRDEEERKPEICVINKEIFFNQYLP